MRQKGNKKNAPPLTADEFRRLAQSYAPAAIKELRRLAKEGSSESVRKAASKALAERGLKS